MRIAGPLLLLLFASLPPNAHAAGEVVVYRCTDARGNLTLGDSPCRKDQTQQTRTMVRPKDPPRKRMAITKTQPMRRLDGSSARPESMTFAPTLVIQSPRTMYECTTPDGATYASDSSEGNPRFVPYWIAGYPLVGRFQRGDRIGTGGVVVSGLDLDTVGGIVLDTDRIDALNATATFDASTFDTTAASSTDLSLRTRHLQIEAHSPPPRPRLYAGAVYGGGAWVRDDCQALPQQESCARLSDRRDAINRRFFNAMPSERDVLSIEERALNARLASDCGAL